MLALTESVRALLAAFRRAPGPTKASDLSTRKLIFVHGLGSSPKTWGKMKALCAADPEIHDVEIESFQYPTAKVFLSVTKRTPTIQELGGELRERVESREGVEVTVAAHSLGGLVAMECAVQCVERGCQPPNLLLYAVPETGSQFATAALGIQPNHVQIAQLSEDSEYLRALSRRWAEQEMEGRMRTLRVNGAMDAVIPEPDHLLGARGHRRTLLLRNHNDIVQPTSNRDMVFEILRSFLSGADHNNNSEFLSAADPLFTVYAPRHEKFYVSRDVDLRVYDAMARGCAWVLGESGIGKTACTRRAAYKAGWRIRNVLLGGLADVTAEKLIFATFEELHEQIGAEDIPRPGNVREAVNGIRALLRNDIGPSVAAYLFDELPLSDNIVAEEFVHLMMDLTSLVENDPLLAGRVVVTFSSIYPPAVRGADTSKFWERFRPVMIGRWHQDDISRLIDNISGALSLNFTEVEKGVILQVSNGSPRVAKKILGRWHFADPQRRDLSRLASEVQMEEV